MEVSTELIQTIEEHPEVVPILRRIIDEYKRDEAVCKQLYPDLTEEDLGKLWDMTVRRNRKRLGI